MTPTDSRHLRTRLTVSTLLLLCAAAFVLPHRALVAQTAATFDSLTARLKAGDTAIDYTALRMAYAKSPAFAPYNISTDSMQRKVFELLDSSRADDAVALANMILDHNYCDPDAHFVAAAAHDKAGHKREYAVHMAIRRGLIFSVINSGAGSTIESPFVVISVAEEYSVLRAMGMHVDGQSLVHNDGHAIDQMDATHRKSGRKQTYFFNVDIPMAALSDALDDKK